MDFAVPADPSVKTKESEKRDKYPELARELKGVENLENRGQIYSINKISQNTEKIPEDLKFTVTQTPVRNHQLILV